MSPRWLLLFAAILLCSVTVRAEPPSVIEAPLFYQPPNFNGAVGKSFKVTMIASRTELSSDERLELTLRIEPVGQFWKPPERPNLKDFKVFPKFNERFHITPAKDHKDRDAKSPNAPPWEFYYRLQPRKGVRVERIPPFAFTWYKPPVDPALPGYFATTYAREIELKVVGRPEDAISPDPIKAPEFIFRVADGRKVLRRETHFGMPSWPVLALLMLTPLFASLAWCMVWRRMYPDAARLARMKRSRAARLALDSLAGLQAVSGADRAARVARIFSQYLRYRMALPGAEPTPVEIELFLAEQGCSRELVDRAVELVRACDAGRFAPTAGVMTSVDLVADAQAVILAFEEKSCSP